MSQMLEYGQQDASYQAAGGLEGIRQLVDDFYLVMDQADMAKEIRAMHAEDLSAARDKLSCFLSGWLGGPRLYQERYGQISIPGFHARWPIGESQRDAWLDCMAEAIARQPWTPAFKHYLLQQLRIPAERVVQAAQARRQL
ncbi:MAG: globin [Gammaproteobacteria bacterium HGW-Gammaproteobacteria-11]|nr:MAG: globin [Gammaproteobacteria bacterium HGW-Gammaproteobacteria-11]